ncbi:hypothetical protein [Actinophytocola sediminis]
MRFEDEVLRRLDRYVRDHPGTSLSSVTSAFVDEAMRTEDHPGIMFRPGPAGRRAGLVAGPDVWQVIDTLLTVRESAAGLADDALVAETAEMIGLAPSQVRVAVRYYAAYRAEIDGWITSNRELAVRTEQQWLAERELLRGETSVQ